MPSVSSTLRAVWRRVIADGANPSFAEAPQDGSAQKENRALITLRVNGKTYQVDAEPGTPLLWVLRDNIGLTGTKYGCGIAQCGACGWPCHALLRTAGERRAQQ